MENPLGMKGSIILVRHNLSIVPPAEHNFGHNTLVSRVTPESIILYFSSIIRQTLIPGQEKQYSRLYFCWPGSSSYRGFPEQTTERSTYAPPQDFSQQNRRSTVLKQKASGVCQLFSSRRRFWCRRCNELVCRRKCPRHLEKEFEPNGIEKQNFE